MTCSLTHMDQEGATNQYPIYELAAEPDKEREGFTRIKKLKFYHVNSANGGLESVPLDDPISLSNALKAIRMINRTIRGGLDGIESDYKKGAQSRRLLLLTDILSLTGLNKSMMPMPEAKSNGRLVVTVMGGNNTAKVVSDYDQHIGANSHLVDVYPPAGTEPKSSYIIDLGVLFHDKFDLTFSNLGRFFKHKDDKAHHPERVIDAIFITHRHKDHISQLAYLVKAGYELPAIIMPPLAIRQIQREMNELKIEKSVQQEIFDKCIIPDYSTIPGDATKDNPHVINIGKASFNLSWENLEGERLGQYERYPVIEHEGNRIRVGPMPHSDPGYMYEFITPAGGHLFTGDFKLDPTIELYQASFEPWLRHVSAKAVSVDSTGALRGRDERTPFEGEIQESIISLFNDNPDRRMICPIIGSNTARLATLVAAMGKTNKKYLIADGKAIEDLVRDLEKVYGIKEWAKREHGVAIVDRSSKEAQRIYAEESNEDYVICPTGTQDEDYSSMNRALRDWLPDNRFSLEANDLIVPLQGPIPVGNNAYRRKAAQFFAEFCIGCDYILPEVIEKETNIKLSGSGHASPVDLAELYRLTGVKTAYVIHGGEEHLEAAKNIANDNNVKACAPRISEGYETLLDGRPRLFRREEAQIVGIRTLLPQKDSFWLRRNFLTTVIPVKVFDSSDTGLAIRGLEQAIAQNLGVDEFYMAAESMAANKLSRSFNRSSANGYLSKAFPFGIERYRNRSVVKFKNGRSFRQKSPDTDVYAQKAVGGYAAFDTETTGIDVDFDFVDQFSIALWDTNQELQFEKEIRQVVPDYHVKSPEALLVTNTSPYDNGDIEPVVFADSMHQSFSSIKQRAKTYYKSLKPEAFKANPHLKPKVIVVAHNLPFDDKFVRKTMGVNLWDKTRPHSSDGMIAVDTRLLARAIYAVRPDAFKVRMKEDGKFLDFTLRALCEENTIPYDEKKAHASALYDSHLAMQLFWKMKEIAPDIVEQMVYNADTSSGELLTDMMGQSTGFDGPHPVFSYMSRRADRAEIRIGSWVGTLGGRYAVVVNLTKDISEVLSMDESSIHKRLLDPHDDSFELIDLKSNPIVLPPSHFYERNAPQKYPKEMIDRKARSIKEHLNYMNPKDGWTNIAERLENVWNKDVRSIESAFNPKEPDLLKPVSVHFDLKKKSLQSAVAHNLMMSATSVFNPVKQAIGRNLKAFRQQATEYFQSLETSNFSVSTDVEKIAFDAVLDSRGVSEQQKFLAGNVAYDISPDLLGSVQQSEIMSYRNFHGLVTLQRAQDAMAMLKADPQRMELYVGDDKKKKKLLKEIERYIEDKSKEFKPNVKVRHHLHPWRNGSSPDLPSLAA